MDRFPFVSVVMPCLNEEKTVGFCVQRALQGIKKTGLKGEVVVCDNGSTDDSVKEAKKAGARVIEEEVKGYGSAYITGIKSAKGDWIVIGDSDGTYDFLQAPKLIDPLNKGFDIVIGSRLKGRIKEGSMPLLNRFIGTPFLNFFLRLFYGLNVSDSQSGMRAFTKEAFQKMELKTRGMEFASEMLVRAAIKKLKVAEASISYSKRVTPSKLSRFRDAWRHIRFMLLFAPTYLFLIPGTFLMGLGLLGVFALSLGPVPFFIRNLDFHSQILASMLALLGYQILMLGIYAKVYSWIEGLIDVGPLIRTTIRHFQLEKGIVLGLLISLVGFLIGLLTFINWAKSGFGVLWAIRPAILSMTLFVLGIQIIFSSFFLSILGIERKHK